MYRFRRQGTEQHFSVFPTKIGLTMFWIRTQLEFSGFIPNWNQPRIVNQCFFREIFEEKNSRLKPGQRNAKCTMFLYQTMVQLPRKTQHNHRFCIFSRAFYLALYYHKLWSIKQDNFLTILNMVFLVMTEIWRKIWKDQRNTYCKQQ